MTINLQLYGGIYLIIFGTIVILLSKFLVKIIPLKLRPLFRILVDLKAYKNEEYLKKYYNDANATRKIRYFGIIFILVGLFIILLAAIGISIPLKK